MSFGIAAKLQKKKGGDKNPLKHFLLLITQSTLHHKLHSGPSFTHTDAARYAMHLQ